MLTSTRVTHMVGSNLNGSKADKVLKSCGKVKFVSPEWILQSVKRNKRQHEFKFLVYKDNNAGSLQAAFFPEKLQQPIEYYIYMYHHTK
ncbi:hypothetical protein V7S43_001235 [Phytophthora oleae]|uniref:BRCT domain-containing protein n=1 Tax=Phytophthora oleae TaxID=2107226 RepID=A0ABD3G317_9STRA